MTPRISVIIPTLDREEQLRRCLESLARQTLRPHEYEVIVVDDGGSRPLDEVVASFRQRLQIGLYRQQRSGPGAARNTGAQYARARWLAFTDDDCRADRNWLKALIDCLERYDNAIVGGRIRNALVGNVYAATSQLLVSHLYEYFNADPLNAVFFTSNNIAVSADLFRRYGGFAFRYPVINAEDRELCSRWRSLGEPLVYAPDAVVHHSHHMTIGQFFQQHFNYGRGAFAYHRLRAARRSGRFRVEPFAFYRRLVAMPFKVEIANALQIACLLGVAQAANAVGFFWEAARRQRRSYDSDLVALEWRVSAGDYQRTGS